MNLRRWGRKVKDRDDSWWNPGSVDGSACVRVTFLKALPLFEINEYKYCQIIKMPGAHHFSGGCYNCFNHPNYRS